MLTAQDQHAPNLHITIQNKVGSGEAKALQKALEPAIIPQDFAFRGLALHAYTGGPWNELQRWPFRG